MSDTKLSEVKVKKEGRFSPIWIVPIIAVLIGAFLVFKSYQDRGVKITISFSTGDGLEIHKTKVKYEGVVVGEVIAINLNKEKDNVDITAELKKEAAYLANEGSEFWVVKPRFTAGGVSGLGTLLSGHFIQVRPGKGKAKYKYVGLEDPPVGDPRLPGLHFDLFADRLGSLQIGSPIYYRQIEVGELHGHSFNEDKTGVKVHAYIKPEYRSLVTDKTRFWNASGVTVKGGLSGVKVHTESLTALLDGGITFDNPHGEIGDPVENGAKFVLYQDSDSAMMTGGLHIVFKVEELGSLKPGSPILYNELQVGEIQGHELTSDNRRVNVHAYIYDKYSHLVKVNSRFWNVSGIKIDAGLSGIKVRTESLQTILDGGIAFSNPWGTNSKVAKQGAMFKLYKSHESAFKTGTLVTITFKESHGLSEGSSIKYKGMEVGRVETVKLNDSLDDIIVQARLHEGADLIAKKGTKFWIAQPEIGLGGVKNVGAIISKFIEVIPGKGAPLYAFTGLEQQPLTTHDADDLKLVLTSDRLASVSTGAPIYFRQIQVGRVMGHELSEKANDVHIHISIDEKYAPLVRRNTEFWNVSGIGLDFYLFGVKAKTESLTSIVKGGIAFATPNEEMGEIVDNGAMFALNERPEKEWLAWSPSIDYQNETLKANRKSKEKNRTEQMVRKNKNGVKAYVSQVPFQP